MTNKKQALIVQSDVILNKTYYEEINLIKDGCLKIFVGQKTKKIIIDKLTVKKDPVNSQHDILITSYNGIKAEDGSGDPGTDAINAGDVILTVNDLADNVNVYIRGANVTFRYGHISLSSKGKPQLSDFKVGCGGKGGDGGICPDSIGKRGIAGNNGGKRIFTPIYIQKTKNHFIKRLNLSKKNDYNLFLQHFGGENTLKKFPKIWNSIQRERSKDSSNSNDDFTLSFLDRGSNASIKSLNQQDENIIKKTNDNLDPYYKIEINNLFTICNCNAKDSGEKKAMGKQPSFCIRNIVIKEAGTDNAIVRFPPDSIITKDPYYISEQIIKDISYQDIKDKHLVVETVYTFNYEKKDPPVIVTCQYPINNNIGDTSEGLFYKYCKLDDPIYKANTKTSNDIKILYGRTPEYNTTDFADVDYFDDTDDALYFSNRDEDPKTHIVTIPTTIIPIKGTIYFKPNSRYKLDKIEFLPYYEETLKEEPEEDFKTTYSIPSITHGNDTVNFIIKMADGSKNKELINGLPLHYRTHIDQYDDSKSYAIFDLYLRKPEERTGYKKFDDHDPAGKYGKYDWEAHPTDAQFYSDNIRQNSCYLVCDIPFRMHFHPHNAPNNVQFFENYVTITGMSDKPKDGEFFQSKNGDTNVYIPKITIYWGCFAADTLITTTEGLKKANEIKRGDKLPVYSGKILTVFQVYVGEDKYIYNIKTTNNKSIRVSSNHAMKLYCENKPDGRKISAWNIKKGDILMTPEGNVEVASAEIEAYNDKVYNFEFGEERIPNYIEANGFWSGDLIAQNEPEKRELTPEQKAICAEWEQLAAELTKKSKEESSST